MAIVYHYFLGCLLALVPTICAAAEYVYPVASAAYIDGIKLYLLYQKSNEHLELWIWDPQTKVGIKALLSTYTPAGIQLIPTGAGFSFVDNGRLRLKLFNNRSASTIVFSKPIYDLSLINWTNEHSLYFSAKYGNHFGIFNATTSGETNVWCHDAMHDYMYPQKIDDSVFFIESCTKADSEIAREYAIGKKIGTSPDNVTHTLYTHGTKPILFLHMISTTEGYFVEHSSEVFLHHALLSCCYYRLIFDGYAWKSEPLFNFDIPTQLLFNNHPETCLHESLLPLMPRHDTEHIYFCHSDIMAMSRRRAGQLDVYRYTKSSGHITRCSQARIGQFFFSPLVVSNTLYFGGVLQEGERAPLTMWMNEDNETCFDLPSLQIS